MVLYKNSIKYYCTKYQGFPGPFSRELYDTLSNISIFVLRHYELQSNINHA